MFKNEKGGDWELKQKKIAGSAASKNTILEVFKDLA